MQVAALAPIPKIVHPSQRAGVVRSAEWCPWPLKCMIDKRPCSVVAIGRSVCSCANCVLFRTGAA
jgi:hypothetical protein